MGRFSNTTETGESPEVFWAEDDSRWSILFSGKSINVGRIRRNAASVEQAGSPVDLKIHPESKILPASKPLKLTPENAFILGMQADLITGDLPDTAMVKFIQLPTGAIICVEDSKPESITKANELLLEPRLYTLGQEAKIQKQLFKGIDELPKEISLKMLFEYENINNACVLLMLAKQMQMGLEELAYLQSCDLVKDEKSGKYQLVFDDNQEPIKAVDMEKIELFEANKIVQKYGNKVFKLAFDFKIIKDENKEII